MPAHSVELPNGLIGLPTAACAITKCQGQNACLGWALNLQANPPRGPDQSAM